MRLLLSFATLLLWTAGLDAQISTDPSGHWEGVISAQFGTIRIEVDIAKNARGEPVGTFSVPERKLQGLPLVTLKIEGTTVAFEPAAIGVRFQGDMAGDGKAIEGLFEGAAGSVPVVLTRNGDARIVPPPRNAAVGQELEGVWSGALHVDGVDKRIVLTVANNGDQTATATMVSVDEGGLEVPVAITQKGPDVSLLVKVVGSSYSGAVNATATEMIGTYTTSNGFDLPLTLRKK